MSATYLHGLVLRAFKYSDAEDFAVVARESAESVGPRMHSGAFMAQDALTWSQMRKDGLASCKAWR